MANIYDQAQNTDLNAPVAQSQQNLDFLRGLYGSQDALTGSFLSRYGGAINGQETTSQAADRIGNQLGIPTLQANANQINTTLANLPSTYNKATTGYDVNTNQLARIIGQKTSELAPAATTANNALTSANATLDKRLGYEQADESKALLPYQSEQSLMSDKFARESTGYTSALQSELDAIISKMNAGVTLSEGERNRAQQLAVLEKQYSLELSNYKAKGDYQKTNDPLGILNLG